MKGFKGTAILAVLVVAFSAYLYFFEYKKGIEEEANKKESARIFSGLKAADVVEIVLKNEGVELELKKTSDGWQVTKPYADLADSSMVDAYLTQLLDLTSNQDVDEGDKIQWAVYGLEQASSTITLKSANKTVSVATGSKKSYDNGFYVRIDDNKKVWLMDSNFGLAINKNPSEYRNKFPFRLKDAEVNTLKFTSGGRVIELQKQKGNWQAVNQKIPIDQQEVENFINNIKNLRSENIVAEDKKAATAIKNFKLSPKTVTLQLGLGGSEEGKTSEKQWEMAFGTDDKVKVFATTSDLPFVFEFPKTKLNEFNREWNDFRPKKILSGIDTQAVDEIVVATPKNRVELLKSGTTWSLKTADPQKEVDNEKVQSLLHKLTSLEIAKFLGTRSGKGLQPAMHEIILKKSGAPVLHLKVGDKFKEKANLRSEQPEEMYYIKIITSDASDETLAMKLAAIDGLLNEQLVRERVKTEDSKNSANKEVHK